jgi:hypothetical protein
MLNHFQRIPAYYHTPYGTHYYWQHPTFQYPCQTVFSSTENQAYPIRNQKDVDVTVFSESLVAYKQLLRDASNVLDHLADSKPFATQVMGAAQISNQKEVERLIHSLGVKSNFEVTYNPDGIHLKFWSDVKGSECCKLDMAIRWR